MKDKKENKEHADFQDQYRRSSNFKNVIPKDEFELDEDGDLHINKDS